MTKGKTADDFASQIRNAWRQSVEGIFTVAAIVDEAAVQLGKKVIGELAGLTSISPATLSKLRTIHSKRARFKTNKADLPVAWTTLYAMSKLTDVQFKKLSEDKKIRPDLTIEVINRYGTIAKRVGDKTSGFVTLATIELPWDISAETRSSIRFQVEAAFAEVTRTAQARIVFPEDKVASRNGDDRAKTSEKLRSLLVQKLSVFDVARSTLAAAEYEQLENAAWQHQHRHQKGSYPYKSSEVRSIEHKEHPYSINGKYPSRSAFLAHLREKKIITPYNPISDFDGLEEVQCIKFAYEYCTARTPKAKGLALKGLKDHVAKGGLNAEHARTYLNMIGRGV